MSSPPTVPHVVLSDGVSIPRLIKGGWQLAGGHGTVDAERAIADMIAFAESGITAFDCADIYTGVEELIGRFLRAWRERHGPGAPPIRVHTKCVPNLADLPSLKRQDIEATIDRSLQRLGVDQLDLVQLHWWDFDIPGCVDAALHLTDLQRAGKLGQLGLTNFDTVHARAVIEAGVPVVTHQCQVSLLDRRALGAMSRLCVERGVRMLAYGTLAGGFFHERWLNAPPPREPLENRSLVKYHLIIEEFGGWDAFQGLLVELDRVARQLDVSLGTVALRWVLDQPMVAAAIVGARHADHLGATLDAGRVQLSPDHRAALDRAVSGAAGPQGDVYGLERQKGGRHAAIMRYNLNRHS